MDRPQPVTPELVSDLRNLRQLNRVFGSYALIEHFLRRWIQPGAQIRVLDLATGSGDIPRLVVDYARKIGAKVTVDAVDQQSSTLEIARGLKRGLSRDRIQQGDVLSFGEEGQYDIVLCSLALHHFDEDTAVQVLERCRQFSSRFVLVSDLRRGLLATVGVYLLTAFIFREVDDPHRCAPFRRARLFLSRISFTRRTRRLEEFRSRKFRFARQAIWLVAGGSETGAAKRSGRSHYIDKDRRAVIRLPSLD